jgi:hypothetical protein
MLLAHLAIALILAVEPNDPIPPNVPLPAELELCIVTAELCVAEATCGGDIDMGDLCVEPYEDCSYGIPEAHEPACRLEYVWCKLELSDKSPDWLGKRCAEVYELCPTG